MASNLTNRQTWTNDDFRDVFAFLEEMRMVLTECPEKTAEYAPVLLQDLDRAANAVIYIMRGTGANV